MIDYKMDFSRSEELAQNLKRLGSRAENLANQYLHDRGTKMVIENIIRFIPVSNKNKSRHAKSSNPLKARLGNLGFTIVTKGGAANKPNSFGYLIFPEEGRGPHNPIAQRFAEKGLNKSEDPVAEGLINALEEAFNEL